MGEHSHYLSAVVTDFLDSQDHPLRNEIERLRQLILNTESGLKESIKWNGPNYSFEGEDRITMRINPPKKLQLVFHRGAKVKPQPAEKLIRDDSNLLVWKENDRAVASFKNLEQLEYNAENLEVIIKAWLIAAS